MRANVLTSSFIHIPCRIYVYCINVQCVHKDCHLCMTQCLPVLTLSEYTFLCECDLWGVWIILHMFTHRRPCMYMYMHAHLCIYTCIKVCVSVCCMIVFSLQVWVPLAFLLCVYVTLTRIHVRVCTHSCVFQHTQVLIPAFMVVIVPFYMYVCTIMHIYMILCMLCVRVTRTL
jgi:hypothetical protein